MSFPSLVGGPECGPVNPLAQVLKHTDSDRSLQQDRIAGPSSSRLHQLTPTAAQHVASEQDLALARQFFEGGPQNHAFSMQHAPDLARMGEIPAPMGEPWAMEQRRQLPMEEAAKGAWAAEFGAAPQVNAPGLHQAGPGVSDYQTQRPSYMGQMGGYGMSRPFGMYGMNSTMQYGVNPGVVVDAKGKGRQVEFDAAFAQYEETQSAKIEEVNELAESLESTTISETQEEKASDFQEVWKQLQESDLPPPQEDMAKWEAEFSALMGNQREELDEYSTGMQQAWESGLGDFSSSDTFATKPLQFDPNGIPLLDDYVFETQNPYLDPSSSRSLLSEAKALLEQNGSLSEAALMLEAAIQRGDTGEGGYEAWILLGETRNMDEREEAGMRALLQGVKIATESGAPGAGMLSLAISFTNESYDRASHTMLLRWFRARYPDVEVPQSTIDAVGKNSTWDTHGKITDLFMTLARVQHSRNEMDPDLQIGLGVLFYTNGEYDRAQDCFVSALGARPKDYLLWNRLGSSLSNGNKPEEALGAYREALQLRPTYTRAIYNVGVACLNIGADKEAAEHFLHALSLQESNNGGSGTSDQLWNTLRRSLMSMGLSQLADLTKPDVKPSLEVFRKEGFDF